MRWQYKTVRLPTAAGILKTKINPAELDAVLHQLGQERWELVELLHVQGEMATDLLGVFKRPEQPVDSVSEMRGMCPGCGYDLRGADHDACPECGWHARPSGEATA